MQLLLLLPVVALLLAAVPSHALEVYAGREPTDARSTHFSVTLQASQARRSSPLLEPMVYQTTSPDEDLAKIHRGSDGKGIFCSLHGAQFCNRTVSWIDYGTTASDNTVSVVVTSLRGADTFKSGFTLRPLSPHMLQLRVLDGGRSAQILLRGGAELKFAVEYGTSPLGSFRDALMIFVGAADPTPSGPSSSILAFKPGVTCVPGDGILQLPAGIRTVFLPRGAWLDGRLNITRYGPNPAGSAVSIVGHGVISGRRFTYHGGTVPDSLRCVEVQLDRALYMDGPTLVDSKGHSLFVPPHSIVTDIKVMGWLYNEDGVWISTNSTLRRSFVRTNDDSIRLYAGALDGFHNVPGPVRGVPAWGVRVEDVIVHQLFNGGVIQIGWEDAGITDSIVSGLEVIRAEWYKTAGPEHRQNNDAVLSLMSPQYDLSMAEHHRNLTLENVRIGSGVASPGVGSTSGHAQGHATVGRVLGLGLYSGTAVSSVHGVTLRNVTSEQLLRWWPTKFGAAAENLAGDNFVFASAPNGSIGGVRIQGAVVAGQRVLKDEDWNMVVIGAQAIVYA